jgi:pimeloyl-ACP methyl ester carboxylesterase/DNA-binding CsgD family transcriptional regulator
MKQQVRFCTSADGTRIAYAMSGNGPPLLMSTTWLTHLEYQHRSLAWRPWLDALSQHYTLIRYDPRGCGMSDRAVADLSFESWMMDFEAVVAASGYQRFSLLGVCWGGPIAMAYAALHPQRISKLVLYGTYARGRLRRTGSPQEIEKARLLLELTQLGWAQENHAFLQVWATAFQPGGTMEHLRSWCEMQRISTSTEMAVALSRVSFDVDVSAMVPRIACPTLVIHADRDAVVPIEEGRIVDSLIADARFVQLDSDNHMLLPAEPAWARFLSELRGFLPEGINYRSASGEQVRLAALTARENDVLNALAQGQSNAQIADGLGRSEKTVRNHITHIFDKLSVQTRAQAIVLAREAGFGQVRHALTR